MAMKPLIPFWAILWASVPGTLAAQQPADTGMVRWISVTDSVGRAIGMNEDQVASWRERNGHWQYKYHALGKDPEHHPGYITLHNARELDLKGFLTGGQYDKWRWMNKRSPRLEQGNPPGTNMPPDR